MLRRRWLALGSLLVVLAVVSTAFSSATSGATSASRAISKVTSSAPKVGGTLTISDAQFLWTCGFSPYNPSSDFLSVGVIYEPLMFVDTLENAKVTPWLATSYAWSDGNKVITFDIRRGVKWTDGKPFTAADVAFTFNMLKKYPALDLNSVWSVLSSVVQKGAYQVVMTFKTAAVPYFYYIADQVGIVPQHIWAGVKNPVTFPDSNPVGTGPYTVQNCTPQNVSYVRNSHYWQPGKPYIEKVEYPAFATNGPANTFLSTGQAQWGGQFIPNLKSFYLDKAKGNSYWFPPVTSVSVFINQTVPLLDNLAVRRAMAFAIDRSRVAQIGEYGYEPPGNQAGVVTPTFSSWLDNSEVSAAGYSYDPSKAISILEKAGFKKGSNGIFVSPKGKQLSFSIINQGAYTDWVAALQVVSQELSAVGIQLTVDNLSGTDYSARLYDGNFQLAYADETGGPSPYYEFRQVLYGPSSAPIGKPAPTNWERYQSASTDALIDSYATSTSSATQHAIVDKLENVMLQDVPTIPVTEQVDWDEYSTTAFGGWPSASDPYAQPYMYVVPDWEVILLRLYQK